MSFNFLELNINAGSLQCKFILTNQIGLLFGIPSNVTKFPSFGEITTTIFHQLVHEITD